jgi:hypothetical protein
MSSPDWPTRSFAEPDYCYGTGPLTLRVEQVDWASPIHLDGETWYYVHGVEVDHGGADRGHRHVLVRGGQLPAPPTAGQPPHLGH